MAEGKCSKQEEEILNREKEKYSFDFSPNTRRKKNLQVSREKGKLEVWPFTPLPSGHGAAALFMSGKVNTPL